MHPIAFGKPFHQIILMFPDALYQITGHAHIQSAIALTGKNINGGLHIAILLDSRLRGNDRDGGKMSTHVFVIPAQAGIQQ